MVNYNYQSQSDDIRMRRHYNGRVELDTYWPRIVEFTAAALGYFVTEGLVTIEPDSDLVLIDLANACACYRITEESSHERWIGVLEFSEIDHAPLPHGPQSHVPLYNWRNPPPPPKRKPDVDEDLEV